MSDEYTHVGSVRRRPRAGHQRSQNSSQNGGNGKANGSHNKHAEDFGDRESEREQEFQRERYFDRGEGRRARSGGAGFNENRRSGKQKQEERPARNPGNYGTELEEEPLFRFPFDPWRLYGAVKRNFGWILCAGALLALVGFFVGTYLVQYKINLPLTRKTGNAVRTENMPVEFMPYQYSEQTLYAFMKSSEVLNSVAEKAAQDPRTAPLRATPKQLAESISIKPTPNPDIVLVSMEVFGGLRPMVDLANLYSREVVSYMRKIQGAKHRTSRCISRANWRSQTRTLPRLQRS